MISDIDLDELVVRWAIEQQNGREPNPTDLCADWPELQLRQHPHFVHSR
jgi:hypothetical protein